ncbi:MAG: polysaccharide biosynthesis C-terminal domain-containing protein [Ferruginibacter sp.]|nr:polysaccharide biosynthesis C-terminal domain-containing protein [Ferruginibacter sp.]
MQTNNKQVFSSLSNKSAMLFTGSMIRLAVQLIILVFFSRHLLVNDYGLFQAVFLFLNLFGIITLFGLPSVILSIPGNNIWEWVRKNKKWVVLFAVLLYGAAILFLIFSNTGYNLSLCSLLFLGLLVQNFAALSESLAIRNNRITSLFYINLLFNALWLGAHLGLLFYNYSLPLLVILIIFSYLIKAVLTVCLKPHHRSDIQTNTVASQWLWLGMFDVVSALFKWIDKWVILVFISVGQFAIYFNGAYEIPLFALMVSAVGSVLIVEFTQKDIDNTRRTALFNHAVKMLSSVVIPIFCFLLFFYKPIFLWVFGQKYAPALPIFFVSLWILPVRIGNFTAALQALQRSDLIFKGACLDLGIALLLMPLFYPWLGLPGIALAFVISTWIQATFYIHHTSKLMNIHVFHYFPIKFLFVLLITCLLIQATLSIFNSYLPSMIWMWVSLALSSIIALWLLFKNRIGIIE